MQKRRIGIVGAAGVVGKAVSDGLERLGHTVFRHDLVYGTTVTDLIDANPEVVFICVPTPKKDDNSCDTSIVEDVFYSLVAEGYTGIIALKSTCTPGTTQGLLDETNRLLQLGALAPTVCFVPEFLRERSAFADFTLNHDVLVVGCEDSAQGDVAWRILVDLHGKYPQEVYRCSPTEAELVKYFSNTYNALRVIWANAFYEVCQKLGASYDKVKGAAVLRDTIEDYYLDCNENWRGYAGVCLEKDPAALAKLATDLGVPAEIFRVIVDDNELYAPTVPGGMRLHG